jgi:glutathione synthase/RimK-type ligase-like ATP-grasp enzyme
MILIITNRQDQTADYLILELKRRKVDYFRFNTEDYPQNAQISWLLDDSGVDGQFIFPRRHIRFEEIKSIWYRRPVPPQANPIITDQENRSFIVDESQVALDGVWKTIECFWVSHPDNIRIAENKLYQLKIAQQVGFNIYPTIVTNYPDDALSFYQSQSVDIVYKPIRHGRLDRGEQIGLVFTSRVETEHAAAFQKIELAPVLFQKYVHKSVELRVTVIGDQVFAVKIFSQKHQDAMDDWRKANPDDLPHESCDLPETIKSQCVRLLRALGLQFGAIDLILTPKGEFIFLEINPNGQWAWLQQLCPEIPLRESLADLLINTNAPDKDFS